MESESPLIYNERFKAERHRVSLAMSGFTLPLLRHMYAAFDGDLVSAMVLGEIATHNVGAWLVARGNDARLVEDMQHHAKVLRPCNALSIAEATGIPRETVRRKVELLINRGWVYRSAGGHLFVHPSVPDNFDPMTAEMVVELLGAADRIKELLAPPQK